MTNQSPPTLYKKCPNSVDGPALTENSLCAVLYECLNPDTLVQIAPAAAGDEVLDSLDTGLEVIIHLGQGALVARSGRMDMSCLLIDLWLYFLFSSVILSVGRSAVFT